MARHKYEIPISPDAPSGSYLLEVGIYQAKTGLTFDEEGSRLKGDRVILAMIRIESDLLNSQNLSRVSP